MERHLLVTTQLSNYDTKGTFILECDSGWMMSTGRIREMLRLSPDLHIDVTGPMREQLRTQPEDFQPDLFEEGRVRYLAHRIIPNALATRYDYDFDGLSRLVCSQESPQYHSVLINDPMHLRAFKAMFLLKAGYRPRFYVHSHFVDVPECPKFPDEASLWLGQCEAAIRADFNFWQCGSALEQFLQSMRKWYAGAVADSVEAHSMPWDDGYSRAEITSPIDMNKVRFSVEQWQELTRGKHVVFFPNRISPSSGDYTNGMKFMFDILPELRKRRQDFVVVCGNPNQKFSNAELQERCGPHGYVSLVPDSFNRDEFKFVATNSHVALGLYDKDAYGGTAARECIELGCMPCWLALNEYKSLAEEAGVASLVLAKPDFSDFEKQLFNILDLKSGVVNLESGRSAHASGLFDRTQRALQDVVRRRCSYEQTTSEAMKIMGLLQEG